MCRRTIWTEENILLLMNNYYTKTSSEIAKVLGVSRAYVNRMASKLGLKRQYNFHKINEDIKHKIIAMYFTDKDSYRKIAALLKLSNSSVANVIREYRRLHPELRMTPKEEYGMKISRARKRLIKDERARALFGLEQHTDINIYRSCERKYYLRFALRSKGYEIDFGSNDVYIEDDTKRSKRLERKASNMGLTFLAPVGEDNGYVSYEEITI